MTDSLLVSAVAFLNDIFGSSSISNPGSSILVKCSMTSFPQVVIRRQCLLECQAQASSRN